MLIHRELGWSGLLDVIAQTSQLLGALFPVLMMALSLNVFLTYQQVPEHLVHWLSGLISDSTTFLLGTNLFLLLMGCLMDIGSAILILAPMLQPIAAEQGIDAVHFGIIMVVNLEMGYLTPPLGLNLIVAMTVFKEEFWTICRAVLPFLAMMLAGLMLVSFLPQLSLFLLG
jgi:C4-dicarboxylate transporter DctM subunit